MASPVRYEDGMLGVFSGCAKSGCAKSGCSETSEAVSMGAELVGLLMVALPEVLPEILAP